MRRDSLLTKALLLVSLLALPASGRAEERVLVLDPARTEVRFTLGATLHSVGGSVRVARGEIRLDPDGGSASGEVVLDARSAQAGNRLRDRDMHQNVLESERFPEIVFRPERVVWDEPGRRSGRMALHGVLAIHGSDHAIVLRTTTTGEGDRVHAEARIEIPYVAWGLKDPSNWLLRVAKQVEVTVSVKGTLLERSP